MKEVVLYDDETSLTPLGKRDTLLSFKLLPSSVLTSTMHPNSTQSHPLVLSQSGRHPLRHMSNSTHANSHAASCRTRVHLRPPRQSKPQPKRASNSSTPSEEHKIKSEYSTDSRFNCKDYVLIFTNPVDDSLRLHSSPCLIL